MKIAIALLGALVGCVSVSAEQESRGLPKRDDLIGIWVPEKESMSEIESRTPSTMPPEIELLSRGSFALHNIPGWWQNVFGKPSGKIGGIAGASWVVVESSEAPELLLQDKTFGVSMVLSIEGKKPPYVVLLYVGGATGRTPVRFYRKSGELNPPNPEGTANGPERPSLTFDVWADQL